MTPDPDKKSPAIWRALKAVNGVVVKIGKAVAWTVAWIVLCVVYYVVFTPASLILKLVRVDPMRRRFDADAESYFVPVKAEPFDPARCRKMY